MDRILIIEDDKALNSGICMALSSENLEFESAYDIKTAKSLVEGKHFDLIILDANLPDGSGFDFLKYLNSSIVTPVIMLTARDMETDIVSAFELGAMDYVTKPFSLAVLRARVGVQLKSNSHKSIYKTERFKFDFDRLEYIVDGSPIELSKTEQKLLRLLIERRGITVTRQQLSNWIWSDGIEYVDENSLSVAIKRLRSKLGTPDAIKTIYGIGYVWSVI